MAWVKGGTTTLTGSSTTIDVSDLPDKKFYMGLEHRLDSNSATHHYLRLGSSGSADSGSNYAYRYSTNGGGDGTGANSSIIAHGFFGDTEPAFMVNYLFNISGEEKLLIAHTVGQNTAGAGNAPKRNKTVGKWANTSNPIDIWQTRAAPIAVGYATYASGTNTSVLAAD